MRARSATLRCAATHVAQVSASLEVIAVVHVHVEWLKMWTLGPRTRSAIKPYVLGIARLAPPCAIAVRIAHFSNIHELDTMNMPNHVFWRCDQF